MDKAIRFQYASQTPCSMRSAAFIHPWMSSWSPMVWGLIHLVRYQSAPSMMRRSQTRMIASARKNHGRLSISVGRG